MKALRNFILAGIIAIVFSALSTRANLIVSVNGALYNVSTVTTTFNADPAQLEAQPFWNNQILAYYLARAVGTQLGTPNSIQDPASGDHLPANPFFALNVNQTSVNNLFDDVGFNALVDFEISSQSSSVTYALATQIPETPSRIVNLAIGLPFLGLAVERLVQRRRNVMV